MKYAFSIDTGFHCNTFCFFIFHRKLPLKEENGKEVLSSDTIEIKVSNDIIQSKEDDSKA